jgi:membrane protein
MRKLWKQWAGLLKDTSLGFVSDNGFSLSASLSYYTVFSLPPLLIIIISISDFFLGPKAITGELFTQIKGLVGSETALKVQTLMRNVRTSGSGTFATVIGVIILIVLASGIFAEMQSSINYIWGIKAKPNRGLIKFLKNRLMSFSMIGLAGVLLLVSLTVSTVMNGLDKGLVASYFPGIGVLVFSVFNTLFGFLSVIVLFLIIFKALPDGAISKRCSIVGAVFTAILFMAGKFLIGSYISASHIASAYGAMGSVILILVWVYYSSIILYLGAEFTKVYTKMYGHKIILSVDSTHVAK